MANASTSNTVSIASPRGGVAIQLLKELMGIVLSVLLFYLAFPNDISVRGFGFLGFVALLPLMWTVNTAPMWRLIIYGPLTGFTTYALFNRWLLNFHPMAIFIVPVIYAVYYTVLIPLLGLTRRGPGNTVLPWSWIAQTLVFLAYEYLRTQGFLGYSYGIIGYTQYLNAPLRGAAEFGGIWLVSALVVAPQFLFAHMISHPDRPPVKELLRRYRRHILALAALILLAGIAGTLARVDYSQAPTMRLALVQQNVDPKIGGTRAYRNSMDASIDQSKLALEAYDNIDMVVWSETSFIPSIDYHSRYRTDPERYELVDQLLEYIDGTGVPFLIGNGDGQLVVGEDGQYKRQDYNAVYLYKSRDDVQIYRKIHLVPFTEHFPYRKQFPWIYNLLVETDTSFWEQGNDWTIFEVDGVRFATPICFEDSFGYLSRGFVRKGAQLIVNLTNDSWSQSVPAAMQHMAMAVFRAVENRRTVVRSTNGGMSVVIDPNGRIIAENQPFTESYIVEDVPVYTGRDGAYTAIGDILAYLFTALGGCCILLFAGIHGKAVFERRGVSDSV